jgi:glycosyltransferase involved in cell wall biosynthesis
MKVAVITPYYREPLEVLERCHRSVLAQTHPSTHFMVADGHPQSAIDGWESVHHLSLAVSHGDWGNTPRSIGSISAFNQGFDAVAYLDADNWYAEDHIASLVDVCTQHQVSVAFSYRQIVLSTGEHCPFLDIGEENGDHIDTNCYFFTKAAAFLAPVWALLDPQFAHTGDRFMRRVIGIGVPRVLGTGRQTVFYVSHWPQHFEAMGKEPPSDARQMDLERLNKPYDPAVNLARLGFDPLEPAS